MISMKTLLANHIFKLFQNRKQGIESYSPDNRMHIKLNDSKRIVNQ
jgi:hypothetical protein